MTPDLNLACVASAIADPARARMLCSLLDGCARTATELAAVAEIGASTASGHFVRMREQGLVKVTMQGKHRYYSLAGTDVAHALESLLVVAGVPRTPFVPSTPPDLCYARSCYRHMAGEIAVKVHDAFILRGFLMPDDQGYVITPAGAQFLDDIGIDVSALMQTRRRLAKPCMDWSARRAHIGGALGDALLARFLTLKWVERALDSRVLRLTKVGERKLFDLFDLNAQGNEVCTSSHAHAQIDLMVSAR